MISNNAPIRPITAGPRHHFFGYFGKSPWYGVAESELVLAHETELLDRMPHPGETVDIGYVLASGEGEFVKVAESRTWNFQQGTMLQWLPGLGKTIVYNDLVDGQPGMVILELEGGRRRELRRPLAALSHDGCTGLSINFGRLQSVRPDYGYAGVRDLYEGHLCPADDGIWRIDMESGEVRLILSLQQIAGLGADGHPPDALHWVNHLLFNLNDTRFCFLHRCRNPAGTLQTRLLTANLDGSGVRILISGMASHFDWRSDTELLAWAGERKLLQSATDGWMRHLPVGPTLKFLYRTLGKPRMLKRNILNDRYLLFDEVTGNKETVGKDQLTCDGHCSFSPDGAWFVTDTYPDAKGNLSLLLYYWFSGNLITAREFYSPPALDNEIRCDLHPRWHPNGQRICVDSAHDGTRQIYEIDVTRIVVR